MHNQSLVARAAHWSATHRKTAIFGWLALVIASIAIGGAIGQNKMSDADQYTGESGRAERALSDAQLKPNTEMVLLEGKRGATIRSPQFKSATKRLTAYLERQPYVKSVRSPLQGESPVTRDGRTALIEYQISGDADQAQDRVAAIHDGVDEIAAANPGLTFHQFGSASANLQVSETINEDLHKAEAISLPITMLILMIAFGSLVAAGLPLILAFSAVIATMSLIALPSQLFPVDDNVASIILLVGLAVGVDYSLFYLRREREERENGHDPATALQIAAATSGHAVLVSGLTVIVAMLGMYLTGDKTFTSLATGSVLVVAVAMVASISVLPALMASLGDRVDRGRLPRLRRRKADGGERAGFWGLVVDRVMRRPKLSLVLAAGVLVALSVPVLGMNPKVTSINDLPREASTMRAYDRIQESFPSKTATAEVVIEADDVRHGDVASGITALRDRAQRSELVLDGIETTYAPDGRTALVKIPIAGSGSDERSIDAAQHLRDDVIPATVGHVEGADVSMTGYAAQSIDEDAQLARSLPIVFAFVLGLTFVLMLVTFRSIVIPIGTIALNMLSLGAAYGVLVLVFQHGWGESLLGFESNGGITAWLPLFLFVILFGLSMDYHVFILSRVREAYDRGSSTEQAIREGISSTAGTVTSAAMVMVAVFAAFATLSFVDMKQMGVGLAAAVLIDATIIRGVLLPAGMKLLGDRTWYLPSWLDRPSRTPSPALEVEPARA